MSFTGQIGTVNSMPENIVPMIGAGGHKYAQALTANLTSTGLLSAMKRYVFNQTSITALRAASRVFKFISVKRTM